MYFGFVKFSEGYDLQILKNNVKEYLILLKVGFIVLHDLIAPHILGSGFLFCKITEQIDVFKPKHNSLSFLRLPVIIFSIIPRIIVALIFFIEIMFFNQIHYFILSLLLLLIPTIWNIFVSLYVRFAESLLEDVPKNVKVIPKGNFEYSFQPLPHLKYEVDDVKEWGDTYIIAIKMYVFGTGTESFKHYQSLLSPYSTLLTSSLYLTAGIYKLIFVLF